MDLKQIRSFVAVYGDGSINRAAERLNIAQPSLSQQIKMLEESVGVQLFERHARGVRPTPAGDRFYEDCRKILGDVESAAQTMREFSSGVSGSLDVGLIPTVTKGVLAQVLPAFIEALPNVELRVVEAFSGTLTDWVTSGELDFAIVTEPPRHDGLEMRVLSAEPLIMVSGHKAGLAHLEPVSIKQLPSVNLVMPSAQHSLRTLIERDIKLGNITPGRIVEIDGLFGALEFIQNTDFSAILPVTTVMSDLDSGAFSVNPIMDVQTSFEFFLVHQTQKPLSLAARDLVNRLENALKHSAAAWAAIRAGAPDVAA
ncbi:MAG: LysR family transcriptional regulator [Alphaproteobacteria bacterium]